MLVSEAQVSKEGKQNEGQPPLAPADKRSRVQMLEGVMKGDVPFSSFIAQHPEVVMQMAERGYVLYQEGAFEKAEQIFRGLEIIDNDEAYYKVALGAIFLAQSRLDEAESILGKAVALRENWGVPLVARGEVLMRQGKLMEAAADLEKVLVMDPEAKEPETKHARLLVAATLANLEQIAAEAEAAAGGKGSATAKAGAGAPAAKPGAKPAAPGAAAAKPKQAASAAPGSKPGATAAKPKSAAKPGAAPAAKPGAAGSPRKK